MEGLGLKICPESRCCGCGACFNACARGAIAMVRDGEGFVRPKVDENVCVHCGRCEVVCPVNHSKGPDRDPTCYIGKSKNEDEVLRSTSGGVFGELAKDVLSRGGCVFGCALSKPEFKATHVMVEDVGGLDALRGSKYFQSEIGDSYRRVRACLDDGRGVLFSGTPCQVAGLKLFLGKNYPRLLTVEIVCHGVGSYRVFRKFLDELERKVGSVAQSVRFRDKGFFKSPTTFSVVFENGDRYVRRSYADPYGRAFMSRLCLRRSCENCPSREGRSGADITIGDYWGAEIFHPAFDRAKGASVIVAHTSAGRAAVQRAAIELEPSGFYKATRFNPSLIRDQPADEAKRKKFFALIEHGSVSRATRICCGGSLFAFAIQRVCDFGRRCISKARRTVCRVRVRGESALPRVGIMTVRRELLVSNYGSFFQHYALREVLKGMGFSPFRIEHGAWIDELLDWLMPLRIIRLRLLAALGRRTGDYNYLGWGTLWNRFRFIPNYLKLVGPLFENRRDSDYAYVAGGDGIWSGSEPSFFLLDLPRHIRRLSYAPSSSWSLNAENPAWRTVFKAVSESYRKISVREQAGVDVCRGIVPLCEVEKVLDPVLLLSSNHYLKLIPQKRPFYRPTLFCYLLNLKSAADLPLDALETAAQKLGCQLKMLGIQGAERFIPHKYRIRADQLEFLGCISAASFVVTNSFHGVVFSVLLKKQFVFVPQKGAQNRRTHNLRQYELLDRFGLNDRIVQMQDADCDFSGVLEREIPWQAVDETLSGERDRSLQWLRNAMA